MYSGIRTQHRGTRTRSNPPIRFASVGSTRVSIETIRFKFDLQQGAGDIVDRDAIDVESFAVESWLGHHYAFEYEYRCTEYANDLL